MFEVVLDYINEFMYKINIEDIIAFCLVFLVFFLLIMLCIFLRRYRKTSLILFFLSFFFLIFGSYYLSAYLSKIYYNVSINEVKVKKLLYSDTVVVKGFLKNIGKKYIRACDLNLKLIKSSSFSNLIDNFRSLSSSSLLISKIKRQEIKVFTFIIEPFTYSGKFKYILNFKCY